MKVFKTKINRNKGLSYDFEVIRFDVVSVKVYLEKTGPSEGLKI